MSRTLVPQLRGVHLRDFCLAVAVLVGWIALGFWLQGKVGWPDTYGFHCGGRSCLLMSYWHSPALLGSRNGFAFALFAWFWFIPAVGIAVVLYARLRTWRNR